MPFSEDKWLPVIWSGDDVWTALYPPVKSRYEAEMILEQNRARTRDPGQFQWRIVKATTTYTVEDP